MVKRFNTPIMHLDLRNMTIEERNKVIADFKAKQEKAQQIGLNKKPTKKKKG